MFWCQVNTRLSAKCIAVTLCLLDCRDCHCGHSTAWRASLDVQQHIGNMQPQTEERVRVLLRSVYALLEALS